MEKENTPVSYDISNMVEVPGIAFPWSVCRHPLSTEAQELHMKWAHGFGIFDCPKEAMKFGAIDIGDLSGRMHPRASLEDLVLISDWCAWLLLRDDRWDSTDDVREWEILAERDRRYLRMMRVNYAEARGVPDEDPDDSLCRALLDLLDRVRTRGAENGLTDPVDGAFITMMRDFFFGSVQQAFYQRRTEYPTLGGYIQMRTVTGGLEILTRVIAAIDGMSLPKEMFELEEIKTLTATSHNVSCWHNDLVSLNKEIMAGEVNNLVLVILHDPETGCDNITDALEMAVGMTYDDLDEFDTVATGVTSDTGSRFHEPSRWYAEMLANRVGGIISWQEECARYKLAIAPTD